jgi:hypothetical protein
MCTTAALDPDIAVKVRALARERGISFEDAINLLLRGSRADARK